jgi:hypothetical protein
VIAAIAPTAPRDQEWDVPAGLDELALDVIKTTGLTLAEFVELEERPEQFGGAENTGWHIIIRNVLGTYWAPLTEALIAPFAYRGDHQVIYRGSREFQLMVSHVMAMERSNGSLTADATREDMDEVLWRWLERVVTRIMDEAEWYVDAASSNFSGLYDECRRSVRRERAQAWPSDAHRSKPA